MGTPTVGRRNFSASERVSETEKLARHTRCSCRVALVSLDTTTTAEEEEEAPRRERLAADTGEDASDLRDGICGNGGISVAKGFYVAG